MLMTGTRDMGVGGLNPDMRIKPYDLVHSVHKYAIVLDRGSHMTFTDMPAKGRHRAQRCYSKRSR